MTKKGECRSLGLLRGAVIAVALLAAAPMAFGQTGNCLLDKAGKDKAPCTAGDDKVISFAIAGDPIECYDGELVAVTLRAVVESTANERYDPGFFVALDGGDAQHGTCQEAYFDEPLTTCSVEDFEAALCSDVYNPSDGEPPFLNLETEVADTCGDQEQGIPTALNVPMTVACSDPDRNGTLELGTCLSWDNQGGASGNLCNVEIGPILGTGSKCRCEILTVEGITVLPDPCEGVVCDDGIACTVDACDPNSEPPGQCVFAADDAFCDDANVCSGVEYCDVDLGCQPGTPLDCSDGVGCTVDACDPVAGCASSADDSLCDDGNVCNGAETCDPALDCQAGTDLDCNDGVGCTVDTCDPLDGCASEPDDGLCDDANVCNGEETCDPAADCQAGTDLDCDDAVGCTVDTCDPLDGCASEPDDALCDDDDVCTGVEVCDPAGDCQDGTDLDCDDGVFCTDETCDPVDGCDSTANDANCDDGVFCTDETCDPALDCRIVPIDGRCDDSDVCTGEEFCDLTADCQAGTPLDCDDGVGCTDDSCDPADGCGSVANDGHCGDGVVCTDDVCDPADDCQFLPNDDHCEDGVGCTDDLCDPVDDCQFVADDANCDDGYWCTVDVCDPVGDCSNTPDDALCIDGRVCTDESCVPDDADAAPSGCLFVFDPDNDPEDCPVEICRTPGFWGNHAKLIQDLLDLGYGGFLVCGVPVDNVEVDWEYSAIEGMCNRPRGDKTLTAARALVATALNCILTAGDPSCAGTTVADDFAALDQACLDGDRGQMNRYHARVDCWNNGGDLDLYDQLGWCVTGQCDGIPGEYCGKDDHCGGSCVPFVDSCHEQPLINATLGFNYEPAGQWKRQRHCHRAIKTECTLPYYGDCWTTP